MVLCYCACKGALLNVWSVIAKSAEVAFQWTDGTISLMQAWIYISYLIAMYPIAWLMDKKGFMYLQSLAQLLACMRM